MKRGRFLVVEAAATLVATGGGPTHYRFFAPGPEKSLDGLAMLYRAGVSIVDMEMLQIHPTGLIVPGSVVAGSLLEEGLRGAGAYLLNADGERFMKRYDPEKMERATRDVVSRSSFLEMSADRGFDHGGVHIEAFHLGAEFVEKNFPGMCLRCKIFGYDLARKPVPVSPTAHYMMGGAVIDAECKTSHERLFVAGEDSGGVHGANRLGGNGIADSCVYGRLAGKALAAYIADGNGTIPETAPGQTESTAAKYIEPFNRRNGDGPYPLRDHLRELNWNKVGVARNGKDLQSAIDEIDAVAVEARKVRIEGVRIFNMLWNNYIDFLNMVDVSRMVASSALLREETRGAHFRTDFPEQNDETGFYNLYLQKGEDGKPVFEKKPVTHSYMKPEDIKN
jgi:succinate dehydrogenase / fumarate reductase flavoprotein subunit/fumarate reductase flavoprotein subunit